MIDLQVLGCNQEEMLEHLEGGDVAETVSTFFEQSSAVVAASKSRASLRDVDGWLSELEGMTREEEQVRKTSQ